MKFLKITPTVTILLPSLICIPIAIQLIKDSHAGGLDTLYYFFSAAIHPSIEPIVLQNSWHGLKITIAIALFSWFFSLLIGVLLGILSSNIFWETLNGRTWIGKIINRVIAIPRAIHEVVWGLLLMQLLGLNQLVAIIAIIIPYSSLIAKVISSQLDTLNKNSLIAIKQGGAGTFSALTTSLLPPMVPILLTYGGYRLECAIRGATLLGVFGLGGIGTELQLTLQSLEFQELWTSLWMLASVMILIEQAITFIKLNKSQKVKTKKGYLNLVIISLLIAISLLSLQSVEINFNALNFQSVDLPKLINIKNAFYQLPLFNLIISTILITLISASIAISVPPLLLMLCPGSLGSSILSFLWLLFRLIPPPLTALLILLSTNPSISVAALALGISNIGIMGRLLKENLDQQSNSLFNAIKSSGTTNQIAWLYGKLTLQSKSYLAYATYRTDVLLRETATVGIVGGIGLGWQLQESISSFAWAEVILITITFISLTLIGELISQKTLENWIKVKSSNSLISFLQA